MNNQEILEHFRQTQAFLEGHFILSSGLHSPNYLQCALALQHPADAVKFAEALATKIVDKEFETVASPAIGGLIIGYAVAQVLNRRFIWTERQNGIMTLRRGFSVAKNEKVLIVEDVITTGGSTRECAETLEKLGAKVEMAASVVDRSNGKADIGIERVWLWGLDVPSYSPENCPLCLNGEPAIKPGSRESGKK